MPQIDTKAILADAKAKATSVKAWELPKVESSVAPPDVWSNIGTSHTLLQCLDMQLMVF